MHALTKGLLLAIGIACLPTATAFGNGAAAPAADATCSGIVAVNCTCGESTNFCAAGDPCLLYLQPPLTQKNCIIGG